MMVTSVMIRSRAILSPPRSRRRQCGQAIYLALAAIIFLSLMTFAGWNISQMTHAKAQTLNAADAGAYTLATVVARDMNFMAYSNRAMVANHVVVGQLVSLASLSKMIYLASKDISILKNFGWVPYIGPILKAIGEAFERLAEIIDSYVLPFLEKLTKFEDALIQGISMMQVAMHGATAHDAQRLEQVIKANDPDLRWASTDGIGIFATASNITGLIQTFSGGFSKQRNDDEAYDRLREVVNLSRDGFTVKRAWIPIPELPFPFKKRNNWLFNGGTQLSSDNKSWVGVEGAEFLVKVCCNWRGKYKDRTLLRAWLTGQIAGSDGVDDWRNLSHGELSSTGHRRAYSNREDRLNNAYRGLRAYQELSGDPKPGEHPTPTFVVLVYKPVQSASTPNATQTFHTGEGTMFHLKDGRSKIYGAAAAQAYFRRPAKNDKDPTKGGMANEYYPNGTYATLFSPYWQPRLTDLPAAISAALLIGADK
jgi:hypothetical protein